MMGHQQENMMRVKYSYNYCHHYFEHDMHKQITEHKIEGTISLHQSLLRNILMRFRDKRKQDYISTL